MADLLSTRLLSSRRTKSTPSHLQTRPLRPPLKTNLSHLSHRRRGTSILTSLLQPHWSQPLTSSHPQLSESGWQNNIKAEISTLLSQINIPALLEKASALHKTNSLCTLRRRSSDPEKEERLTGCANRQIPPRLLRRRQHKPGSCAPHAPGSLTCSARTHSSMKLVKSRRLHRSNSTSLSRSEGLRSGEAWLRRVCGSLGLKREV